MLSPRTGLGIEAKNTGLGLGLGLDGNGLGLETLRPRPRVVWPHGLVYYSVFISCSVATATVKSVIMETSLTTPEVDKVEKNWETVFGHTGVTIWH